MDDNFSITSILDDIFNATGVDVTRYRKHKNNNGYDIFVRTPAELTDVSEYCRACHRNITVLRPI